MNIQNKFKTFTLVVLACVTLTFSACKRNKDVDDDSNQKVAVDNSFAESEVNASLDMSEQALENPTVQARTANTSNEKVPIIFPQGGIGGCATIDIVTPAGQPNVRNVTIDFGTQGCTGNDGRVRRGKILVTFTRPSNTVGGFNPFNVVGTSSVITFDNYYTNDVKVEGTKTITVNEFTAPTPNNNFAFLRRVNIQMVNGKLTFPDGTTHLWNTNRNRRLSGVFTPMQTPQQWRSTMLLNIWGNYAGVNRNGVTYSGNCNETQPLLFKYSCPPTIRRPVSGVLTITRSTRPNAVLDFGQGSCDNIFTVTVNGNTYTIN